MWINYKSMFIFYESLVCFGVALAVKDITPPPLSFTVSVSTISSKTEFWGWVCVCACVCACVRACAWVFFMVFVCVSLCGSRLLWFCMLLCVFKLIYFIRIKFHKSMKSFPNVLVHRWNNVLGAETPDTLFSRQSWNRSDLDCRLQSNTFCVCKASLQRSLHLFEKPSEGSFRHITHVHSNLHVTRSNPDSYPDPNTLRLRQGKPSTEAFKW